MNNKQAKELLLKYSKGECTPEEKAWVESWYLNDFSNTEKITAEEIEKASKIIRHNLPKPVAPVKRIWPRIAAAASIILAVSFGTYLLINRSKTAQIADYSQSILPKQNGVTLTLANGKKIKLDQTHSGKIKVSESSEIVQTQTEIKYNVGNTISTDQNTLTNNSANKFSLLLSDGSQVFLDVASSITYPVKFTGKERRVSITGQAYFIVKHNADKSFFVNTKTETIEDIGTEFNVDAYPEDNELKTTLINGSVRIQTGNNNNPLILKPGEQTLLNNDKLSVTTADLESVTAWMQGKLVFNHENLENIFINISRIYGVKFIWQDEQLKTLKYNGAVSREKTLSTILNYFRNNGEVDFQTNGNTIKVFRNKN